MLRKFTLLGLVIFALLMLVLSGCGGRKSGNGGGNGGPVFVDFDAEAFEGTAWRCAKSGDRPQITVYIDELVEDHGSLGCYYTGSVVCDTTGTINITEDDIEGHNLGKYIRLLGTEVGGNQIIAVNIAATSNNDDYIQIDGFFSSTTTDTMTASYLLVDYYDEMAYSDYEHESKESTEDIVFTKLILI